MRLRTFGSWMRAKALLRCRPSAVAMKSRTKTELASSATPSTERTRPTRPGWKGAPSKKKAGGTFSVRRNLLQAARADAIGAFFVFLDLLKRQSQRLAKLFLNLIPRRIRRMRTRLPT